MTDQDSNHLAKADGQDEDDPLAELARIVSGETTPKRSAPEDGVTASETPSQTPDPANAPQQAAETGSAETGSDDHREFEDDPALDMESALLNELGETPDGTPAESVPSAEAEAEALETPASPRPQAELAADTPVADTSQPHTPAYDDWETAAGEPADAAPAESGSLEDQLLAELDSEEEDATPFGAPGYLTDAESDGTEIDRVERVAEDFSSHEPSSDQFEKPVDTPGESTALEVDFGDAFNTEFDQLSARGYERPAEPDYRGAVASDLGEFDSENTTFAGDDMDQPESGEPAGALLENSFAQAFADELDLDPEASGEPAERADWPARDGENDPSVATAADAEPGIADPQAEYADLDPAGSPDEATQPVEAVGDDAAPAESSRNGAKLALGALVLALVIGGGVAGWGYYSGVGGFAGLGEGAGDGEPEIVRADSDPVKIRPENPGGREIANQENQVYDRVAGSDPDGDAPTQENLVSSREQPVPPVPASTPKAENRLTPGEDPAADTAAPASPLGLQPKRVKTFTVKPDGTIIATPPEEPAAQATTSLLDDDASSATGLNIGAGSQAGSETASPPTTDGDAALSGAGTPVSTAASPDASAEASTGDASAAVSLDASPDASTGDAVPGDEPLPDSVSPVETLAAVQAQEAANGTGETADGSDTDTADNGPLSGLSPAEIPVPTKRPPFTRRAPAASGATDASTDGATTNSTASASTDNSGAPTQIASREAATSESTNAGGASGSAAPIAEWKVQVSSQRSQDAAQASFRNLQRRFSSILGGRRASIEQASIEGQGTFYRVKVFAQSQNEATDLCNRLKRAGGSCFVTR